MRWNSRQDKVYVAEYHKHRTGLTKIKYIYQTDSFVNTMLNMFNLMAISLLSCIWIARRGAARCGAVWHSTAMLYDTLLIFSLMRKVKHVFVTQNRKENFCMHHVNGDFNLYQNSNHEMYSFVKCKKSE